jgi:hypothetical protein
MKTKKIYYVLLPLIFALIVHLLFWYRNAFEPLSSWNPMSRDFSVVFMFLSIIVGILFVWFEIDKK